MNDSMNDEAMKNTNKRNHTNHARVTPLLLTAALAVAACSGSDDADRPTEEELAETLSTLGGETVDDVSITHEPGSPTVSIGGLDVALPMAVEYQLFDPDPNILIAPNWPTLFQRTFEHPDLPEESPEFGLATLAQKDLVSTEEDRRFLFDSAFASAGNDEFDVIHTSMITNSTTDISCWTEIRRGTRARGFDSAQGVTLFTGPGIAAGAITTFTPGFADPVPGFVGDVVEAICGERPDGL